MGESLSADEAGRSGVPGVWSPATPPISPPRSARPRREAVAAAQINTDLVMGSALAVAVERDPAPVGGS